jgi:hypothetical protein
MVTNMLVYWEYELVVGGLIGYNNRQIDKRGGKGMITEAYIASPWEILLVNMSRLTR